jgi:hypothetical protein
MDCKTNPNTLDDFEHKIATNSTYSVGNGVLDGFYGETVCNVAKGNAINGNNAILDLQAGAKGSSTSQDVAHGDGG